MECNAYMSIACIYNCNIFIVIMKCASFYTCICSLCWFLLSAQMQVIIFLLLFIKVQFIFLLWLIKFLESLGINNIVYFFIELFTHKWQGPKGIQVYRIFLINVFPFVWKLLISAFKQLYSELLEGIILRANIKLFMWKDI